MKYFLFMLCLLSSSLSAQSKWEFQATYTPILLSYSQFQTMEAELKNLGCDKPKQITTNMGIGMNIFHKKLGIHSELLGSYPSFSSEISNVQHIQTNLLFSYLILQKGICQFRPVIGLGTSTAILRTQQETPANYEEYVESPRTLNFTHDSFFQDIGLQLYLNREDLPSMIRVGYRFSADYAWGVEQQELTGAPTDRLNQWYISIKGCVRVKMKKKKA